MEKKNNNILLLGIKEDNLIYLTYQIDFKTNNEIRTKMLIAEQQNHEHGPLCSAYIYNLHPLTFPDYTFITNIYN